MAYVVQYGDTPEGIAARLGIAWEDVVRLNPMLQINPRFIYAGLTLQVPATRPRTVTPQPQTPEILPPATRPRYVNPPQTTPPATDDKPKGEKTLSQMLGLDKLRQQDRDLLKWGGLALAFLLAYQAVKD